MVSSYTLQGAECSISSLGSFNWTDVPAGNLFFLIVGVDQSDCYESSWGRNSSGDERNGATPSNLCGATLKDTSEVCR